MNRVYWTAAICALALAQPAVANDGVAAPAAAESAGARYTRFSGEPVKHIRAGNVRGWEAMDPEHLVLFTSYTEAWLLDVAGRCLDVQMAVRIALTHENKQIYSGIDKVRVGTQECAVTQIRPVDLPAYQMAKREVEGASLEVGQASELLHAELIARQVEPLGS